jgi:hypothetical protein
VKRAGLFIGFLFAASLCLAAQQEMPPNDVDLLASYCAGFLSARSDAMQTEPILQPLMERDNATRRRIAGYLLPRLPHLDPTGLLTASKQAESDFAEARGRIQQCIASCNGRPAPQQSMCLQQCNQGGYFARFDRCRDAAFLPY